MNNLTHKFFATRDEKEVFFCESSSRRLTKKMIKQKQKTSKKANIKPEFHTEREISVTNKRLYISDNFNDKEVINIVELSAINYVNVGNQKVKYKPALLIACGFLLMIVGFVGFLFFGLLSLIATAVGFLAVIIGFIINLYKNNYTLEIGISPHAIDVDCTLFRDIDILMLQKMIFVAKQAQIDGVDLPAFRHIR